MDRDELLDRIDEAVSMAMDSCAEDAEKMTGSTHFESFCWTDGGEGEGEVVIRASTEVLANAPFLPADARARLAGVADGIHEDAMHEARMSVRYGGRRYRSEEEYDDAVDCAYDREVGGLDSSEYEAVFSCMRTDEGDGFALSFSLELDGKREAVLSVKYPDIVVEQAQERDLASDICGKLCQAAKCAPIPKGGPKP